MEHWLPLFHADLVPLTAYLGEGAEIGLDHLALDAIKARAALIGEHYEARLQPPAAGSSFGSAVYRPLPPELLYLDEGGLARALEPFARVQLPPRQVSTTAMRTRADEWLRRSRSCTSGSFSPCGNTNCPSE